MNSNEKGIKCGATAVVDGVAVECDRDYTHSYTSSMDYACRHFSPVHNQEDGRLWIEWTELAIPTVGGVLEREGRA